MNKKRDTKRYGLTLTELMIGVAIIALLASLAVFNYSKIKELVRDGFTTFELRILEGAVTRFRIDNHRYPLSWDELAPYIRRPERVRKEYSLNPSLNL